MSLVETPAIGGPPSLYGLAEFAQQVCIIYAVTHGYLNGIDVAKIPEFEKQLEVHMENFHPQVLEAIRTSGKLESDTEAGLKAALDELLLQFA